MPSLPSFFIRLFVLCIITTNLSLHAVTHHREILDLDTAACRIKDIDRTSVKYRWKIPGRCKHLLLYNSSLSDDDGSYLLNAFGTMTELKSHSVEVLDLNFNSLGTKSAALLSNLLFTYSHFTHVYLGDINGLWLSLNLEEEAVRFYVCMSRRKPNSQHSPTPLSTLPYHTLSRS